MQTCSKGAMDLLALMYRMTLQAIPLLSSWKLLIKQAAGGC